MNSKPIPSSEFLHIDRSDSDPIAECAVCRVRLAFRHYYGMPVCFVCEQNTSSIAYSRDLGRGLEALSMALRFFYPEEARS